MSTHAFVMPYTVPKKRRGNPNWGRGNFPVANGESMFERKVRELGLKESEYDHNPELIAWVTANCHRKYVPEWLLEELGLDVRVKLSAEWGDELNKSHLGIPNHRREGRKKAAE